MKHSLFCKQSYFAMRVWQTVQSEVELILIGAPTSFIHIVLFSFRFGLSLEFACWSSNNSSLQGASGGRQAEQVTANKL